LENSVYQIFSSRITRLFINQIPEKMNKVIIHKQTREIIQLVYIKKGDYEHDFDKLVDSNGNEWLPEELEVKFIDTLAF